MFNKSFFKNERVVYLSVFLLSVLAWSGNLFYWFGVYDLGFIYKYIAAPLNVNGFVDLSSLIRNHLLLTYPFYIWFGYQPFYYYLFADLLHGLSAVCFYFLLNKLFKDRKAAFLISLAFSINVVYSNLLYEGIFNYYYNLIFSLLIIIILISSWFVENEIVKYKLVIIASLTILALLLREIALLIVPITIFYLLTIESRKYLSKKIAIMLTLLTAALIYLLVRNIWLGTLPSDLTDDGVQARNTFLSSGRYLQYTLLSFLNFFRIIAEQVIPFPILYSVRSYIHNFVFSNASSVIITYFASILGCGISVLVVFMSFLIYKSKLNQSLKNIFVFGLSWWIVTNCFFAFGLPFPSGVFSREYNFQTVLSRYNYFGLTGFLMSLTVVILYFQIKLPWLKRCTFLILIYFVLQVGFILYGSYKIYTDRHQKLSLFYESFYTLNPSLPNKTLIYYNFFQTQNLTDYLVDFVTTVGKNRYPNTQFILESNLSHVQVDYQRSGHSIDNLYAYDLDSNGYLVDKSRLLRESINNLRQVKLGSLVIDSHKDSEGIIDIKDNILANFSYILSFKVRGYPYYPLSPKEQCKISNLPYLFSREIEDLMVVDQQREVFRKQSKITSSSNYGKNNPRFHFIKPENLIDGQPFKTSSWKADISADKQYIVVDLGESKVATGLGWISGGGNGNPESYIIESSDDNQTWNLIKKVTNNKNKSRIDNFDQVIKARYIKVTFLSTSLGQEVELYEVEVLNYPRIVLTKYKKMEDLDNDLYYLNCQEASSDNHLRQWGSVSWETNLKTKEERYISFPMDGEWYEIKLKINNLEIYSKSRQILDEKLKEIKIFPGFLHSYFEISNIQLQPEGTN